MGQKLEKRSQILGNPADVPHSITDHQNIWVNYNDLTVFSNPGIMVNVWEIMPKWPQDSG